MVGLTSPLFLKFETFFMLKKTEKSRISLLCSLRAKEYCQRMDSALSNDWKKAVPRQTLGGISYERDTPLYQRVRAYAHSSICTSLDEWRRDFGLSPEDHYTPWLTMRPDETRQIFPNTLMLMVPWAHTLWDSAAIFCLFYVDYHKLAQ